MKLFLFLGPLAVTAEEELTQCQKEAKRSPDDRYNPMKFYPACDSDGNYDQFQSWDLINRCWCCTKDGRFIPGTVTNSLEKCPLCEDEFFAADSTSCRKAVTEAESSPLLVGKFVPKCDNEGYCKKRQFSASTGFTWCSEKNTENCGPIPGTQSGPGEPFKICPGDDILRGPEPLNYGQAKLFCERSGLYLPEPTDAKRNQELKGYGSTWIDVLPEISTQTGSYGNWAGRQRTFLMENGDWQVALASEAKEFYCVDRTPMSCDDTFKSIIPQPVFSPQFALWNISYPWQTKYHWATEEDFVDISRGTRFKYECPFPGTDKIIKDYPYYFRCVRVNTEEESVVRCLDGSKCKKFKRQPIKVTEDYGDFTCWVFGED